MEAQTEAGLGLNSGTSLRFRPASALSQRHDALLEVLKEMKGKMCVKEHKITALRRA